MNEFSNVDARYVYSGNIYLLKSTIKTLEKELKCVQS